MTAATHAQSPRSVVIADRCPCPAPAERAWFQQVQAYEDAIAYRTARLAAPCPECGPQPCDDHATDADLITGYQRAASMGRPGRQPGHA